MTRVLRRLPLEHVADITRAIVAAFMAARARRDSNCLAVVLRAGIGAA
jgi:hypothetical protein